MILIRHPRADIAPGICYGRLDLPLASGAEAEIARAAAGLPCGVRVLTSPAQRCRALAAALSESPEVDPRLQELDFGAWEGRAWDAIDRAESDPWAADPWRVAPPGGETFAQVHARVGAVLGGLQGQAAILVTHAGPIRAARMIVEGAGFDAVFAEPVPYARPIRLGPAAAA